MQGSDEENGANKHLIVQRPCLVKLQLQSVQLCQVLVGSCHMRVCRAKPLLRFGERPLEIPLGPLEVPLSGSPSFVHARAVTE